ncbi:50S ribosomal protein L18 [Desulforhopalus singaporensis]|uniref:Large ribosomal subunit protein uL18 n=1 Tax=Desulforhopalus singaporensis TaxID=91360 RepID=A0A1H0RBE2_9BACT|nr:50S ribosomal protein L18 [Desulforhopalus singaporensis]SDP26922.1 LSU ribosomal protein L18P [Desulforhopalus singaporensis]
MARKNPNTVAREKRVRRIRKKITGTSERPRLRVFKSNKHIYAQIIDDSAGKTLVSMSTIDKEFEPGEEKGKASLAKKVGELLATRAKAAGITKVIFDRGGCLYHGRVKSLSEGAREGGLEF